MTQLSKKDIRLINDVAGYTTCFRQLKDGWYTKSCYEQGLGVRQCCIGCRTLKRLEKRLSSDD